MLSCVLSLNCFSLQSWLNFSRFLELGAILEPGRPPKADKIAILADAARMVHQLRVEAQKLKESNEELQAKIKELKVKLKHVHQMLVFLRSDLCIKTIKMVV